MEIDVKRNDLVLKTGIIFKKKFIYYEYIITSTLTEEEWLGVGKMRDQKMDIEFPTGLSEAPPNISREIRSEELLSLIYRRIEKKKKKGVENWNSYTWVPRTFANKVIAENWFNQVVDEWKKVKNIIENNKEVDGIENKSSISL